MRTAILSGILSACWIGAEPARAALEASVSAIPGRVAVGSILTVACTVTNTGVSDETGVFAELQVDNGSGLLVDPTGPVPAGPLTITAGGTTTFAWTFSVTGAGILDFTVTATGSLPVSDSVSATAAIPAALSAAASISRDPAPVGGWIEAVLTVTNTGGVDALAVGPSSEFTTGGSLVETISGPVPATVASLAPGGAASFTWTLSASGSGAVALTMSATGQDALFATAVGAVAPGASLTLLPPAALSVSVFTIPFVITAGASYGVLITVSNTGGFVATGVVPSFEVNEGAAGPFSSLSPASADLQPGSSTVFFCGLATTGPGIVRLTVTADGFDTGLGQPVSAAGSASATVITPAALSASLLAGPSPVTAGAVLTVTLWVQNTGEEAAWVTPAISASSGAGRVALRSSPGPGAVEIAGLNLVPFVWTWSVAGCGTVSFTASVSGNAVVVYVPISAWAATAPVALKGDPWDPTDDVPAGATPVPATAGGSAHAPHALCAADVADWYAVSLLAGRAYELTTRGSGSGDAYGELFSDADAGTVLAFDDDGAGSLQFAIDYTPVATATRYLRVRTVPAGSDWSGGVQVRERLAAAAVVLPALQQVGRWVEVRVTVTNTGATTLLSPTPSASVVSGAERIALVSTPSGIGSLAPGAAATFTWTVSISGAGAAVVRVGVDGIDAVTSHAVAAWAEATVSGTDATVLAAALAVAPSAAPAGSWVRTVLTVTNTGGTGATGVVPAIQTDAGGGLVVAIGGASPAGPVAIPAGGSQSFTWTWSVSGAGTVRWTATASGMDAIVATPVSGAASGSLVAGAAAQLVAAASAWSTPVVTGAVVTVVVTATNTGGTTATGAVPSLVPVGAVAPLTGPLPAGPVAITAGAAQSFTWTFSATGCGPATFSGSVAATDATTGEPVSASAGANGVIKGDPFDPADDTATSGNALAPAPFAWGLHGPHALCAADTADWYRVSLARGAAYRLETSGSGDAFAELFDDAAGTQVLAADTDSAGNQQPRLTVTALRAGTFWLRVRTVPAGADWSGEVRHRQVLASALSVSPAVAVVGEPVEIVLTVTNGGAANLTGATGAISTGPGLAIFATPAAAPVPAAGSASFTWTASVTGSGEVSLTATVAGIELGTGLGLATFGSASVTGLRPAALAVATAAWPDPAATGQWITVTATVTNTGDETATGVAPTLGWTQGSGLVAAIAGPAGAVVLAPGASATFTWTWSASGAGPLAYSVSAAGTGALTAAPVLGAASRALVIQNRATLIASLLLSPTQAEIGQVVRAVLSVTNTGSFDATEVVPEIEATAGGGLAFDLAGPVPAGPVTIASGGHAYFTWSYSITGAGGIAFTATASGIAAGSGVPAQVAATGSVATAAPPAVVATLAISPAAPVGGQWVTVTLSAVNNGGVDAVGVVPAVSVNRGTALLTAVAGPVPAGPVTLAAGGGSQAFIWTWSVNGAGGVEWTATAAGLDAWTAQPVRAAATAAAVQLAPAALTASLVLTSSSPWGFVAGGRLTAVLTVVNAGEVDAVGVLPAAGPHAGGGFLGPVDGPVPAGPVTVPALGTAAFTWTWTLTGEGAIGCSATVTGADAITALPLVARAAAGAAVVGRGDLIAQLSAPTTAREGDSFEVTLTLANPGDEPVVLAAPVLGPSDPARAGVTAGPWPVAPGMVPGTLAAGAEVRVRWTVRALREGSVALVASATGRRISDDSVATASAAAAVAVQEAFDGDHPVVAWPNPAAGDGLTVAVRIKKPADRVVVEVYSAAYRKVADGEWTGVTPGAGAQLRLTGVSRWATGVYLVRAKAWYADGKQETFPPMKLAVKR